MISEKRMVGAIIDQVDGVIEFPHGAHTHTHTAGRCFIV